jgi:magnesium transporter
MNSVNWQDLTNPSQDELLKLAQSFNALSTHVSDCLDPEHLPKIEIIGDAYFIIIRYMDPQAQDHDLEIVKLTRKIALFITPNQLLTVHRAPINFITQLKNETTQPRKDNKPWDHHLIALHIIKKAINSFDPMIGQLEDFLSRAEEVMFAKKLDENFLITLHNKKRKIFILKKLLNQTNVIIREINFSNIVFKPYLQDLREVGHAQFIYADDLVDQSTNLIQTFITLSDYQSNKVMQILTMFSMFFLPLTFITGLYGMNFHSMPELDWKYGYLYVWLLIVATVFAIYLYFRSKKWIK